jgi:WD40 repeat protein
VENVLAGFFYTQHNIRLNSEVFDRLNRMGKLLLIFDGFDEMADKIDTQKMTDNFWELAKVVTTNAKVILTCRTEHFPTAQDERENMSGERTHSLRLRSGNANTQVAVAPKFETLELLKFDDEQIREVLSRRTNLATVELVMANSQLLDLLRRAVMAEFILEALPEIEAGKPIDLARVYLYAVRHKMERDITTGRTFTSLADKLYFLCELAWEMLSEDKMSLNYREFPDRLRVLFKNEVKEQKHLDHWHYDMMGQTMLIRNDEGDYSPAHRSLLEFFVAYKLAAELGLLADDFLEMAQSQSGIDKDLTPKFYTWSDYWRRDVDDKGVRELIAPLAGFKSEPPEKLRGTFGREPLTKAVLDLLLPSINLEVNYRESNQLLDLIKFTKAADVGYLGGNVSTVLVKLNSDALEYQDLNNTNLAHANLVNAGLRGTNLSGANLENCQVTRVFGSIAAISMSKDNRQFFTAHDDGTIRIWDLYSCQELKKLIGHHKNVNCIVLSADGQFLYSGGADCKIKEWKLADGNCQHTFEGHQSSINCVALSVDGQFLYSGGQDRTIKEWKLEDKICQRNFNSVPRLIDRVKLMLTSGVLAITLSSNGQYLYAGCDDGIIEEWKLADGKCQRNFVDGNYSISAITLSTDGQWLYSGGSSIKEWKLADGSCQRTFRGGHHNSINALLLSDCGQWIYSSSGDATIKEWKLADGTCQRTLTGSPGSLIKPLAMSKDGQMLYSSSSNAIEEYKIIDGTCQRIFESYQDPIGTIALSEDGKFLYSSAKNGSIKEWDLTSGICQRTFREHQSLVRTIALSRDRKWLYAGSDNGLIERWNLKNGICQRTLDSHQDSVTAITISENGQLLYFSGGKEIISEWNLVNDICQRTFTGQQQSIRTIALSQDGKLLYAGSHNGIEEWKLANGTSQYTTVDCPIFMSNSPIALSKDRQLFCHGSLNSFSTEGSAIEEWKLDGSCRNFKSNKDVVSAIAISDDSQLLYSDSEDGTIKEWDVATGECLRSIDTRLCAGANITNVKGLTPAQTDALLALGAFSDD